MPDVSAIVVNWNDGDRLLRCLDSLASGNIEAIVVDNASSDSSPQRVADRFPAARVSAQTSNLGFAGGVNLGARLATGRYLLILNTDIVAAPGAVGALASFLDTHTACGAVTGELVGEDGRPQRGWSVHRFPTLASLAVELLLVDRVWPSNPVSRRHRMLDVSYDGPLQVDQPAAACLMVRRDVFEQLGGMDERFHPAWFEDVDFCVRLHAAGWDAYLVPGAVFHHAGGVARDRLGARAFALAWYRNLEAFAGKHYGAGRRLAVKALIVAGMAERIAICALSGNAAGVRTFARVAAQALGLVAAAREPLARGR